MVNHSMNIADLFFFFDQTCGNWSATAIYKEVLSLLIKLYEATSFRNGCIQDPWSFWISFAKVKIFLEQHQVTACSLYKSAYIIFMKVVDEESNLGFKTWIEKQFRFTKRILESSNEIFRIYPSLQLCKDVLQELILSFLGSGSCMYIIWYYLPTPPLGQDMTQGQFLSRV